MTHGIRMIGNNVMMNRIFICWDMVEADRLVVVLQIVGMYIVVIPFGVVERWIGKFAVEYIGDYGIVM